MKMNITQNSNTADIREAFENAFDGLKVEFFHHSHKKAEGSPKKDMVSESAEVAQLNPNLKPMSFELNKSMTVNEVERIFEEKLGLHVQVFRKMNITWIETTATDGFTLERQIELSRESRGLNN